MNLKKNKIVPLFELIWVIPLMSKNNSIGGDIGSDIDGKSGSVIRR